MGKGTFWRIPDKPLITAVFFDVDGTLTDAQGKVPENYANVLHYMAQSVPLYLATSLSVEQARRKLGKTLFSVCSKVGHLQTVDYCCMTGGTDVYRLNYYRM